MKFFFTPRRVKGAMKRGVRVTGGKGDEGEGEGVEGVGEEGR